MEKTLKITPPEGYEIDIEKSTLDNIVFKEIEKTIIKWNSTWKGVEIIEKGEHFILDAQLPSFCCSWNDAIRFDVDSIWKLPTAKQLLIIARHTQEINKIIEKNEGYEIRGYLWSDKETSEDMAYGAFSECMWHTHRNKDCLGLVRKVKTLK